MIQVTRLNGKEYYLNAELLETVEATPDTVVTLSTERKYVVRESVEEVVKRVIDYKQACLSPILRQAGAHGGT